MDAVNIAACLLTLVFAVLRLSGQFNDSAVFKDLAHVFVGGLFGVAIGTKDKLFWGRKESFWCLAIGLCVVEIVAALIGVIR